MTGSLLRTPLADWHSAHGGRMVDFAGWSMPVQYGSIVAEHQATRRAAGLFDVSHMGEVEFRGKGALEAANRLITNDLARIADGQAVYAGLLNDRGGFVDDVVAYRFSPERILIVVNASNKDKDFAWMLARAEGVKPVDRSDDYAQIAVQGPKAPGLVQRLRRLTCPRWAPTASPRARWRASSASSPVPATRARTASSCTALRTTRRSCGTPCCRRARRTA